MLKNIALSALGITLLITPLAASAQATSTSSNASLIATLTALVQQLEQQIQQLLAARPSTSVPSSSPQSAASGMTTDVALVCNASTALKRGDTDAATGGKVSRLQKMLGISPTTGFYGALTGIGYNNTCIGGNAQPTAVAGMSKYTDSNFGFSFWYPSTQQVSIVSTSNNATQQYGTNTSISKTISAPEFTIDEVYSQSGQILGDETNDPSPVSSHFYYFFDSNKGQWMEYTDGGPKGGPAGTVAADISNNTMGGLHIFAGYTRFGIKDIIPLTAHNFLVLWAKCNDATDYSCSPSTTLTSGTNRFNTSVNTIVATDPTVAIPVSTSQQTATIQAEASAYEVALITDTPQSYSVPYINSQYGFSIVYPSNLALQTDPKLLQSGMGPDNTLLSLKVNGSNGMASGTFEVIVDSYSPDVANCLTVPPTTETSFTNKGNVSIGGITFLHFTSYSPAAGQFGASDIYHTVQRGSCYALSLTVTGVEAGHLPVSQQPLVQNDITQVQGQLNPIVQSFIFTQ
jgi:hypothetical protein